MALLPPLVVLCGEATAGVRLPYHHAIPLLRLLRGLLALLDGQAGGVLHVLLAPWLLLLRLHSRILHWLLLLWLPRPTCPMRRAGAAALLLVLLLLLSPGLRLLHTLLHTLLYTLLYRLLYRLLLGGRGDSRGRRVEGVPLHLAAPDACGCRCLLGATAAQPVGPCWPHVPHILLPLRLLLQAG
jgi:hypothetical protein